MFPCSQQPSKAPRLSILASCGGALAASLLLCGTASAHIELLEPQARYGPDQQKAPPCGHPANPPGEHPPTVLSGGETITVRIDEFIAHPGHFRIAIAPSDAEFVDPTSYTDFYNADNVLLDDIDNPPGSQVHEIELQVPDVDCDPCVMQVLQIMTENPTFSQASLYYQCADIVIEASAAAETGENEETGSNEETGDDPTNGPDDDTGLTNGETADESAGDGPRPGDTEGDETGSNPSGGGGDGDGGCSCTTSDQRPTAALLLPLLLGGVLRRRRR